MAGLLLFRALARRKEFAVRSALGSPRSVMIRQLLTESVVMAVMSGALGVFLGHIGTKFLSAFTQTNLPQVVDVPVDARVLAFTLAISVFSGIVFGLVPSLELSRPNLSGTLIEEGRGSAGNRQRNRARAVLVTAQVALSMVLLIGSGLLIRSFVRLRTVAAGFNAQGTLTAQTFLPPTSYPQPEVFFPFSQYPYPTLYLTLRTAGVDPHNVASALRAQIAAVDHDQPITDVQTMDERLAAASAPPRSLMLLLGDFSVTA